MSDEWFHADFAHLQHSIDRHGYELTFYKNFFSGSDVDPVLLCFAVEFILPGGHAAIVQIGLSIRNTVQQLIARLY